MSSKSRTRWFSVVRTPRAESSSAYSRSFVVGLVNDSGVTGPDLRGARVEQSAHQLARIRRARCAANRSAARAAHSNDDARSWISERKGFAACASRIARARRGGFRSSVCFLAPCGAASVRAIAGPRAGRASSHSFARELRGVDLASSALETLGSKPEAVSRRAP